MASHSSIPSSLPAPSTPLFSRFPMIHKELLSLSNSILHEYVSKLWFSSISTNKDFKKQIMGVMAHMTYALEERLIKVDWNRAFFSDFAYLWQQHCSAYEASKSSILSHLYFSTEPVTLDMMYHSLVPHVAMSNTLAEKEYLRCFVDHAIQQLGPSYLPEVELERLMYREILTFLLGSAMDFLADPEFLLPTITYWLKPSSVPSKTMSMPWWKRIQIPFQRIWSQAVIGYNTLKLLMRQKPAMSHLDLALLNILEPVLRHNSRTLGFTVHVWHAWLRPPCRWFAGPILDAYLGASLHQFLSQQVMARWIRHLHLQLFPSPIKPTPAMDSSDSTTPPPLLMAPIHERLKIGVLESRYRNKHLYFLLLDAWVWYVFPELLSKQSVGLWPPPKRPIQNVTKTTVTGITAGKATHRKSKSVGSATPIPRTSFPGAPTL